MKQRVRRRLAERLERLLGWALIAGSAVLLAVALLQRDWESVPGTMLFMALGGRFLVAPRYRQLATAGIFTAVLVFVVVRAVQGEWAWALAGLVPGALLALMLRPRREAVR
ncbi:hypothetical protein [Motilibacter aurantiacus]|uniref:hypothetical protein n=1 Tax=Motilibacter aurantiacus TaxID=2714955 RepID=UPI00140B2BD7|nr:hypothetical protein [Motilibacter aurantiacus]NHC43958.1 hypothetical protein [Motilibacter aurantiacus]